MRRLAVVLLLAAAPSCSRGDDAPRRAPPPPTPTTKAGVCDKEPGQIKDAQGKPLFPVASSGYCLDPNGADKAFGEGAPQNIDAICDVFDGECEIYKSFGIRRLVDARYVDGAGSAATIDVHLSKFASVEGAYAMFTKRVVGDGDPVEGTSKPIDGGGAAALGLGNAYVWRGQFLGELVFNDPTAAEAALKTKSDALLPPLVGALGEKLPGATGLPIAANALPAEDRLPLGIRMFTKDALGIDGLGSAAIGYYRVGEKRFRVAALARDDEEQAKDVLTAFGKLPGATYEKHVAGGAIHTMLTDGGVAVEWFFARAGKIAFGVGDEPRVLPPSTTADQHAKVCLSKDEKGTRLARIAK